MPNYTLLIVRQGAENGCIQGMQAERVIKQQVAREVHQLTTSAGFCCEVLRYGVLMAGLFCYTTTNRESADVLSRMLVGIAKN